MKYTIQIFIAIIILIAGFKLGEMKGRWDIVSKRYYPINKIEKVDNDIHSLIKDFNYLRGIR